MNSTVSYIEMLGYRVKLPVLHQGGNVKYATDAEVGGIDDISISTYED